MCSASEPADVVAIGMKGILFVGTGVDPIIVHKAEAAFVEV